MAIKPQQWADNWGSGTQNDNAKLQAGIESVQTSPGEKAAAAADLWETNTIAAKQKFINRSKAVTLSSWKEAAIKKGIPNRRNAIALAKPRVMRYAQAAAPIYDQLQSSMPARGTTIQENLQRVAHFALGLNEAANNGSLDYQR